MNFDLPKSAGIRFDGKRLQTYEAFFLLLRTASSFDRTSNLFKLFNLKLKDSPVKNLKTLYSELYNKGFILNDLHYLDNYYYENIGGVLKGICNLDGTFNHFNLVKHPSYEEVLEELEIIAKGFPDLEVTATIYDKCISDDFKKPAFSFFISKGIVTPTENHLKSLPYVHKDYEYLNYQHLDLFCKFLSSCPSQIYTEYFDQCLIHKNFIGFI